MTLGSPIPDRVDPKVYTSNRPVKQGTYLSSVLNM